MRRGGEKREEKNDGVMGLNTPPISEERKEKSGLIYVVLCGFLTPQLRV